MRTTILFLLIGSILGFIRRWWNRRKMERWEMSMFEPQERWED